MKSHAPVPQGASAGGARAAVRAAPLAASVRQVVEAPGSEMDPRTRASMERRLGFDFGHVRIHADDRAADAAGQLGAGAFTVGNHIAFGRGGYRPASADGQALLQHELVHVVQQSTADGGFAVGAPGDPFEREADGLASATMLLRPVLRTPGAMLQKAPLPGAVVPLSEPSVLAAIDKVFEAKGIAYATEVTVELSVVDSTGSTITVQRRFDRAFTETGDYVFVEAKGANPNSLTPAQKLVDRLAQEKGATFKVIEAGGKPPGGVRVRSLAFSKGFTGTIKPGSLQHVSGAVGGSTPATATNSMDVLTWRAGMNQKYVDVAPGSTAVRYTKPNTAPVKLPQQDVAKVIPPPRAKVSAPEWMNRPLKPPSRVPPPEEIVTTEPVPPSARLSRAANAAEEVVQATDPVIEAELGAQASQRARAGAGAGALEESMAIPKVRVDAAKPPGGGAAAGEVGAVAESEAAVAARASGLGKAVRIGGSIAVIVGTIVLHKVISDMEQAQAKADMEKIAPQIDAQVGALSSAILDRQLAAPWNPVYIQVSLTESFRVTEAGGSAWTSMTESYVDTKLVSVSIANGSQGTSSSERRGPRHSFAQGEAVGAVYELYRDITYTQACKRLTYDELLTYVNDMIAHAPEDKRDELKAKAAKIKQLKKEAQVRVEKEKKKQEDDLIAKMETLPAPPPQPKPQPLALGPGELAAPSPPAAIGPFNLEPSALKVETERVDYLFVKRNRLIAMLDALDRSDAAAVSAFKDQRNTWGQQLKYLHERLKTEQPTLALRLQELFAWVKGDGHRMWELS